MLDLSGVENFEQVMHDYVQSHSTTYYGLTATTPQMPATSKIHKTIREVQPDARIILGGPHITLIHAAQLRSEERRVGKECRSRWSPYH